MERVADWLSGKRKKQEMADEVLSHEVDRKA